MTFSLLSSSRDSTDSRNSIGWISKLAPWIHRWPSKSSPRILIASSSTSAPLYGVNWPKNAKRLRGRDIGSSGTAVGDRHHPLRLDLDAVGRYAPVDVAVTHVFAWAR